MPFFTINKEKYLYCTYSETFMLWDIIFSQQQGTFGHDTRYLQLERNVYYIFMSHLLFFLTIKKIKLRFMENIITNDL